MSLNTAVLRNAIVLAMTVGTLTTGAALAQAPGDDASTLDAVTVTGSRISVPGVEASSPVTSVERSEFLATQPVTVESFLKEVPSISASMGPGVNFGGTGAATIDMRGLGDNRTLILVDGRRPIPFDLNNVVDTNTIPMSLLQSVDILTGGASVVYGADAVAGVTNFIMRRDFEGVEFRSNWGRTRYDDGAKRSHEVTFGALSDDGRANAVLSIGFTKVEPVLQGDRPYARMGLNSNTGGPSGSTTTVPQIVVFPGLGDVLGNPNSNAGQVDPEHGVFGPIRTLYQDPSQYFLSALERWQATALARYEFNPYAEAYAQIAYTRSQVFNLWGAGGTFNETINVPLLNPYLTDGMRQQLCSAYKIDAAQCASGRDASGDLIYTPMSSNRRMSELGGRENGFDTKTFQTTVGLRGMLSEQWNYDGYWSYGESDSLRSAGNTASRRRTLQAMNAISQTECIDPSGGCVPLNLFGGEGSISEKMMDFIRTGGYNIQRVEQTNAAFNLDGNLGEFKSPWTDYPIGIAAGLEYRRTRAGNSSDASFQELNELMGYGSIPNSQGGFDITEAYLESIIPLVNGFQGVDNLSLELGYRRSEFSNAGGVDTDYGSWKYGLTWSPVDTLKIRFMQQRATRAPNIDELFRPEGLSTQNSSTDPCAQGAINQADADTPGTLSWLCRETGVPFEQVGRLPQPSASQVISRLRGNPQLRPEKADTTTIGLVWTPSQQLSVTLDYWNVEINDAIEIPTVQDIFEGCYSAERNPNYVVNDLCVLASGRHPLDGTYNGIGGQGIFLPRTNSGFRQKTGLDLGIRFGHSLPSMLGRMQYAWDISKVTKDKSQTIPTSIVRDCLGYYSTTCSLSHDLRSTLRSTWTVADFSVNLTWRYYGGIDVEPLAEVARRYFEPYRHIASYSYFDLAASWNAPLNLTFSLSVNNLLDKNPPIVGNSIGSDRQNAGNTFPQWYDGLGRYYNVGVTYRF